MLFHTSSENIHYLIIFTTISNDTTTHDSGKIGQHRISNLDLFLFVLFTFAAVLCYSLSFWGFFVNVFFYMVGVVCCSCRGNVILWYGYVRSRLKSR